MRTERASEKVLGAALLEGPANAGLTSRFSIDPHAEDAAMGARAGAAGHDVVAADGGTGADGLAALRPGRRLGR